MNHIVFLPSISKLANPKTSEELNPEFTIIQIIQLYFKYVNSPYRRVRANSRSHIAENQWNRSFPSITSILEFRILATKKISLLKLCCIKYALNTLAPRRSKSKKDGNLQVRSIGGYWNIGFVLRANHQTLLKFDFS